MDYFIAYEVENPVNLFFYKPIRFDTNFLKIELDGNSIKNLNLNSNKFYKLHFILDGNNFVFIGKPYRIEGNKVIMFVKESHIELRRYPRVDVWNLKIVVRLNLLTGYLKDVSLGGCKIAFEKPVPLNYLQSSYPQKISIKVDKFKEIEMPIKIVGISKDRRFISCTFAEKSVKVLELYQTVLKKIKGETN